MLMDDMMWIIGFVSKLEEKLIDAVKEGEITYRSAIEIASMHDHRYGTDFEVTVVEGCK